MKKILHLSHTDISSDSRILKEIDALKVLPECSLLAVGLANQKLGGGIQVINGLSIESIDLHAKKLPRKLRGLIVGVEMTLRFIFRGLKTRPSVVHCHDTLALPAGVIIKVLTGAKLVYDAHELESRRNGMSPLFGKFIFLCERICWSNVNLLISVSPSIIDWYHRQIGQKAAVLVLNSPVYDLSSQPKGGVRQRYFHSLYGIPDDKSVYVYLGFLTRGRGIEMCLEAFAKLDVDAHVVFIGTGELASRIEEYAREATNIHHHQPVPHSEVVGLVQSADFGLCFIENVSLSDYFCLPNKLFEYVFAGVPVLASNLPEMKRVIEKYELGVCCEPSADLIAAMLRNPVSLPRKDNSKELSELSWEAQASRLIEGYQRLLPELPVSVKIVKSDC